MAELILDQKSVIVELTKPQIIVEMASRPLITAVLEQKPPVVIELGTVGLQGIQGPIGPQGVQGIQGIQGEKGDRGEQGLRGFTGEKGDKGDQGLKGDTGDVGPQGPVGPQGERGFTGADSTVPGPKGDKGDQGDIGPKGDTGERGPQGLKGDTGDQGPQGPIGLTGAKGDTGAVGPKGDQGIQGIQGVKGNTGATGAKGDKGDTGATGAKGDQGIQGIQGLKGDKGDKGDTGPVGPTPDMSLYALKNSPVFFGHPKIEGPAGSDRILTMTTAGKSRWSLLAQSAAETGGNAGSDFWITNYNDDGSYKGSPFVIRRSDNRFEFFGPAVMYSTLSVGAITAANLTINEGFLYADGSNTVLAVGPAATRKYYSWKHSDGTFNALNGGITAAGRIKSEGGFVAHSSPDGIMARYKANDTSFGKAVLQYKDTDNFYFLVTDNDDANGGFNGLRPFFLNLNNGQVQMHNGVEVRGYLNLLDADLAVGTGAARVNVQRGNLEIRNSVYGPYIDFSKDADTNFHGRLSYRASDNRFQLEANGGNLHIGSGGAVNAVSSDGTQDGRVLTLGGAEQTLAKQLTFPSYKNPTDADAAAMLEVRGEGGGYGAYMKFHRPGVHGLYFGIDGNNNFIHGGWTDGGPHTMWDSRNLRVDTSRNGDTVVKRNGDGSIDAKLLYTPRGQFGENASSGFYMDNNVAIRTPVANGTIYLQDLSGAQNYGIFGNGGIDFYKSLYMNGNLVQFRNGGLNNGLLFQMANSQDLRMIQKSPNFIHWINESAGFEMGSISNNGYLFMRDGVEGNQLRTRNELYVQNWMRSLTGAGWYFDNLGRGMCAPEQENISYGHLTTYGVGRNGWSGINLGQNNCTWMSNHTGEWGIYNAAGGYWWMNVQIGTGDFVFRGNVTAYSDLRKKEIIERGISNAKERRDNLAASAIIYRRTDIENAPVTLGFGAQWLREGANPELVIEADDALKIRDGLGTLSVNYEKTVAILAVASKETDDKVAELEARIEKLEAFISRMMADD